MNRPRGKIGSLAERGFRCIRPGAASPKPSPIAWNTLTVKLIHSVCSGRKGVPPAMLKMPAPRKVKMKAKRVPIWYRT